MNRKLIIVIVILAFLLAASLIVISCLLSSTSNRAVISPQSHTPQSPFIQATSIAESQTAEVDVAKEPVFIVPIYNGEEIIILDEDRCLFDADFMIEEYLHFSDLDSLGRCGPAEACIGVSLLATESRGPIGMIKPSGWHTIRYEFIDGNYLYNRCHLIAYQLSGVNSDERNLITGTRYLNMEGMLPLENRVYNYIISTGNHVFYRVTPRFSENDLLAKGVEIEAYSIEDNGEGLNFHVFCFNVQPGVTIDYHTGESYASDSITRSIDSDNDDSVYTPSDGVTFVLNTNTKRFHLVTCQSVYEMKSKNRKEFFGTREELLDQGYVPCGRCNP